MHVDAAVGVGDLLGEALLMLRGVADFVAVTLDLRLGGLVTLLKLADAFFEARGTATERGLLGSQLIERGLILDDGVDGVLTQFQTLEVFLCGQGTLIQALEGSVDGSAERRPDEGADCETGVACHV